MKINDEELKVAVANSQSWANVIKTLNLKIGGQSYAIVKARVADLGLSTEHFRGQGWSKGLDNSNPSVAARGRKKLNEQ